jgi:predicted PhzF superfamily epimerase YddE/YHI9
MRIPYFQVNAFTTSPFGGNPAGVCPLEDWLPAPLLQQIAAENNLSETAFFVRVRPDIPAGESGTKVSEATAEGRGEPDGFELRWFTPTVEVDLCGHATLASAHVIFNELRHPSASLGFQTRSGRLGVARRGASLELDFPSRPPVACAAPERLIRALGAVPREVLKSRDYLALFDSPSQVAALRPDMDQLSQVDSLGVIATAPGGGVDFVSRFFAPRAGVPEDPVTGSAHCTLIPFWSGRLGKTELAARQISRRGGELRCRLAGERVGIAGEAVVYCRGELEVPVG